MSKEIYDDIRNNKDKYPLHIVALAGFCATYNAKWFGGYAGIVHTKAGAVRDYYNEAVRNVLAQIDDLMDVKFDCVDFFSDDMKPKGAVLYCDCPYQDSVGYAYKFDNDRYWDKVRNLSRDNYVFCSEYVAPDDFKCIWQKELTTTLDKASRSKSTEKLFIYKGGLR